MFSISSQALTGSSRRSMAATSTENEKSNYQDESPRMWTLYDRYQATLRPQLQETSNTGKSYSYKFWKKNKKQDGSRSTTAAAAEPEAAAGSNGDISGNNSGEGGSSSQKEKIVKIYEKPPGVRGFMKDEMSLEIMLLQPGKEGSIKKLGVVGMPAVGKTALCWLILENPRVMLKYTQRVWISLSENANLEETHTDPIIEPSSNANQATNEIAEDTNTEVEPIIEHNSNVDELSKDKTEDTNTESEPIIEHNSNVDELSKEETEDTNTEAEPIIEQNSNVDELSKDKTEDTNTEAEPVIEQNSNVDELGDLITKLKVQLKGKKYLIVVDDVGEAEEEEYYEKIKKCLDDKDPEGKGGAVIVTCRSEEAAKKVVGDENLHRLQPLNHARNCWWIYNEAVEGKRMDENKVMKVSKEVEEELMKRCGGLPGAARMLGQIKAQQLREENQNNNTGAS